MIEQKEILESVAAMTDEGKQQLVDMLAASLPEKRAAVLKEQLASKLSDVEAGKARSKDLIQQLIARIEAGDLTVVIPTQDELTAAFDGR